MDIVLIDVGQSTQYEKIYTLEHQERTPQSQRTLRVLVKREYAYSTLYATRMEAHCIDLSRVTGLLSLNRIHPMEIRYENAS